MKHVLKEPSCYRDFCKDAVLHLSLLKIKIFISWAKWGVSYPSFGGCSMSSGWTSHYKTLFLITPLHKANPLNFSACGLYLGFHSWELKVPKLLQYRSETLRGFSFSHHQANKTFMCQKKKRKCTSFPITQISCTDLSLLCGIYINISVQNQFLLLL